MPAAPQNSRYFTFIKPLIDKQILKNRIVRSYASYIFSLITIIILIIFAIRPTLVTISNLQKNIETNQQVLDTLNLKAKNLSQGQRNYQTLDANVKSKIRQSVPYSPDITTLIRSLELATPPQASISAIQVQPIVVYDSTQIVGTHPILGEVEFTYNIAGEYNQITTAITNLSKLPRLISITNLTINRQQEGPTTLSVTGKGYYLK